ncbi:MAG TPA: hypothetical protein VK013_05805 [Myxococcaceae bacterium]|nr:hypothetical protein [Myxococcaceae bacterium]
MAERARRVLLLAALALTATTGCASRHLARTVGAGNSEARVSIGGPLFSNLGAPIPLPNVALGGRYGVADGWDVDGNVSLLGAAVGVAYLDPGVVKQLFVQERGAALSASARANLFIGSSEGLAVRVYPEVGLHGELPLGPSAKVFGGGTAWISFTPPEGKSPVMVTPYLGASWRFGEHPRGGPELSLQLGWVSPWMDSSSVVAWEPKGHGAVTALLGLSVPFGGG